MAQKPVARVGDPGSHGGSITTGSSTFSDLGKPVARVGDIYACPVHGPNPIVTGAPTGFDLQRNIAHVGSLTACGAVITAGSPTFAINVAESGNISGMGALGGTPGYPVPPEEPPISSEELCATVNAVKKSDSVKKSLEEAVRQTRKTGKEHAGWIVEDAPGQYKVDNVFVGEDMYVISDPPPPNAVGHFHTHVYQGIPDVSADDQIFQANPGNKVPFFLILGNTGFEVFSDTHGNDIPCPNKDHFIKDMMLLE